MTHPIYESTQLTSKSLTQLKEIAEAIGCVEVTDKRRKESWVTSILNYQSTQVQKKPEISSLFQNLSEQVNTIRYAWEDSGYECVNYEDGDLWLSVEPSSDVYVMWETGKNETDVVNEILSKISTPPVVEEQPQTCLTCPLFKPFNDGTGRGLCCGSDQVSRDHHPRTGDCDHMVKDAANNLTVNLPEGQEAASNPTVNLPEAEQFKHYAEGYIHDREAWIDIYEDSCLQVCEKLFVYFPQGQVNNLTANLPEGYQQPKSVQSSSLTYKPTDRGVGTYEVWDGTEKYGTITMLVDGRWTHSVAPITYGTPYEAAGGLIESTEAMQSFSEDIEVDSDYDSDFGLLYRVWKGWNLLGTFYHALDGQWVAQPCESDARPRCNTAYIAQLSILAVAELLVVGEAKHKELAIA